MGRTEDRILADPTDAPYGVGWWAPHPGTSRRILMSDLLYACTASVSTNLVEAGIHLLELIDARECRSRRCGLYWKRSSTASPGGRVAVSDRGTLRSYTICYTIRGAGSATSL